MLEACGPVDLFIHPIAFATRYFKEGSRIGKEDPMPISRDRLRGLVRGHRETPKPTAVCEGLIVTGEVPRLTDFEDTGFANIFFP